jgi:hypothetical protein
LLIEVPQLTANDLFLELQVPSLRVLQPMTTAAMPILLGLRFHVSFSHGACDPVKVSVRADGHRFLPDELWAASDSGSGNEEVMSGPSQEIRITPAVLNSMKPSI